MFIELPIEPIPSRYSVQWNEWFYLGILAAEHLRHYNYIRLLPTSITESVTSVTQFLNSWDTNIFKASQTLQLIRSIKEGHTDKPVVVFFHDLWHPALTQLFYLRDTLKVDIRIVGILHAGAYDANDFLAKTCNPSWITPTEKAWFNSVDSILVASDYHYKMLKPMCKNWRKIIRVVNFPVHFGEDEPLPLRENIAVFPHRLAEEKQPWYFDQVVAQAAQSGCEVVPYKSMEMTFSKETFYDLLRRSKVAFSSALQETFGISMVEAVMRGCIPLVPNTVAYQELYPTFFRYVGMGEAVTKLKMFMKEYDSIVRDGIYQKLIAKLRTDHEPRSAVAGILKTINF